MALILEVLECDSKACLMGRRYNTRSYVCPHNNLLINHPELCEDQAEPGF